MKNKSFVTLFVLLFVFILIVGLIDPKPKGIYEWVMVIIPISSVLVFLLAKLLHRL